VLSAEFAKDAVLDQMADLRFMVTPTAPWAYAKRSGEFLTITPNGEFPPADATKGILLIGTSTKPTNFGDRRQFAEKHLLSIPAATDITLDTCEPVEIDGMQGFESIGSGDAKGSGAALCIYEVVLFAPDGQNYSSISGVIAADQRDTGLKDLRAMARSFRRKPTAK
jgi:hypothetical protein